MSELETSVMVGLPTLIICYKCNIFTFLTLKQMPHSGLNPPQKKTVFWPSLGKFQVYKLSFHPELWVKPQILHTCAIAFHLTTNWSKWSYEPSLTKEIPVSGLIMVVLASKL